MVLAEFLTETRKRWLKAFKVFKHKRMCKSGKNRVSPALVRSPSYSGTVDARAEILLQHYRGGPGGPGGPGGRASMPPLPATDSFSDCGDSCSDHSLDSAYDSARSIPAVADAPDSAAAPAPGSAPATLYATVTYINVNDSDDTSSIRTEYTVLDYEGELEADDDDDDDDDDEVAQNAINESIELVSSL